MMYLSTQLATAVHTEKQRRWFSSNGNMAGSHRPQFQHTWKHAVVNDGSHFWLIFEHNVFVPIQKHSLSRVWASLPEILPSALICRYMPRLWLSAPKRKKPWRQQTQLSAGLFHKNEAYLCRGGHLWHGCQKIREGWSQAGKMIERREVRWWRGEQTGTRERHVEPFGNKSEVYKNK